MTILGFPLNAVSESPANSGEDIRLAMSALMFGASGTRMLGAKSGMRVGVPSTVVSVSGFNYSVAPHSGILDVQTSNTAGPYQYAITAAETGTIDAAHATLARVDILTIRVDDPQEDATTTPLLEVVYKANPTAGTGLPPATDTTREHVIAHINVPASGGGNPTVTWKAGYTVAAGGIIPVADDTERDLLSTNYGATQTLYAHHADDGLIVWPAGGSAWTQVGATSAWTTWATAPTGITVGNGTLVQKYKVVGDIVFVQGMFTLGSTSAVASTPVLTHPVTAASPSSLDNFPLGDAAFLDTGTASYNAYVMGVNTTTCWLRTAVASGTYTTPGGLSNTVPFTWTTGDVMMWRYQYATA